MPEFKMLAIDKILVPERLRAVEEDHAFMIGQSIARVGLLNPVTVRATPRAARPWTLVAGAHRYRGCELVGRAEIEAIVVKADQTDSQLVEIEENVFRNELSALDRAIFVRRYRELWEEKHGAIARGNPALSNSANIAELSEDTAQGHYFQRVAERMGLSRRAVEYAQFIGAKLTPELRARLRGTPEADNQSRLLTLAKFEPERQRSIANALGLGHDIKAAIEHTDDNAQAKEKRSDQDMLIDRLIDTWGRADAKTRKRFLDHIKGDRPPRERLPSLSELIAAPEGGDGA